MGTPTVKATTIFQTLAWLGMATSYSRPRVSNDNAYAEAWFRTAKYAPQFPAKGFSTIDDARDWAQRFVEWYNTQHRHSGIRYVTPEQRHTGEDREILQNRDLLYQQARTKNPLRWTRNTRDWSYIECVALNPERDTLLRTTVASSQSISSG